METIVNKRSGEIHESPQRSGQYYSIANEWFFSVREGKEQGPYFSKLSAEIGLKMYLLDIEHFKANKKLETKDVKLF